LIRGIASGPVSRVREYNHDFGTFKNPAISSIVAKFSLIRTSNKNDLKTKKTISQNNCRRRVYNRNKKGLLSKMVSKLNWLCKPQTFRVYRKIGVYIFDSSSINSIASSLVKSNELM